MPSPYGRSTTRRVSRQISPRSIRKNELEAKIPITANAKARTGEWQIVFLGKTSINGNVESSTQLMTLQIVQPFFDLKIPSLTVRQGGDPSR